jgi:bacteriocin biosynthesis cyclodehydratase domain-containing protein
MRPILRPGTHVLHRSPGQLQVGLHPQRAVLLPDTAPVRATLVALGRSVPAEAHTDAATLSLLDAAGLLVDERSLLPLLGPTEPGVRRHAVAALARRLGDAGPRAHRSRADCIADLRDDGSALGRRLHEQVGSLLLDAGVRRPPKARPRRPGLGVLVAVGEPDRELTDDWTRAGTPYAVLRLTEGDAVVGPFVLPSQTACLRCVDAHCTDADPAWPLLVRQYARAAAHERGDGAPEPVDPPLAAVAVGWLARDVVTFLDGGTPTSWSATVVLDPELRSIEIRRWLRHPECGCAWM